MALELKTDREVQLIVNNVVLACKNIRKLNKRGYNFIYQASGFIAHYNLLGFIEYYENEGNLKEEILRNQGYNQWANFHLGEKNYSYYMQKKQIYNRICDRLMEVNHG